MTVDIKGQIQDIAKDLLNLEIDTIVKPNITGRKMPELNIALADIGRKYNIKLTTLGCPLKPEKGTEWGSHGSFGLLLETSEREIEKLKKIARAREGLGKEQEGDLWMLYRIKTMSQAILNIFEQKENGEWAVQPTPAKLVLIRKAWELGVEEIALKTVVQLDGDVITRVRTSYTTKEHTTLHKLHNMGVSTSLEFWKTLVDIVGSSLKSLIHMFNPGRWF